MNMSNPRISVYMITYNQVNLIERSLGSLIKQKEYLYEVCVNDDCSNDGTWEKLLKYQKEYPGFIKPYRNQQNIGIFQNVEEAWKRPTGDIVCRLAGDDEVGEGYFGHVIDFIENNNIDYHTELFCIYCDYIQRNKDGASIKYDNNKLVTDKNAIKLKIRKLLYGRGACYSINVLHKFVNVSQGRSFNAELVQDCQIQLFANKNYYIPYVGNIYYAQIGVSTKLTSKDRSANVFEGYNRFCDFVAEYGKPLDQKDLNFIKYMKAFRSGKKIKMLYYYFKSIDFSLGLAGLQLNRIAFVVKHRLLNKNKKIK